jgi:hypothetical protein
MSDMLKLFHDRRLTASEPHHLTFIKGRLAAMKAEGDLSYDTWSKFYGVDLEVQVTKEPEVKEAPKKRGRKAKVVIEQA